MSLVEPHRCSTLQHCCLDEDLEAKHLGSLGCSSQEQLFSRSSSSSFWWASGKNHEINKQRQIHYILRHRTIFTQVRGRKSAPVERHLHDRKQPRTRHVNLAHWVPISIKLWGTVLSKSCQNFLESLDLLVREERALASERPVSHPALGWEAIFVKNQFSGC